MIIQIIGNRIRGDARDVATRMGLNQKGNFTVGGPDEAVAAGVCGAVPVGNGCWCNPI